MIIEMLRCSDKRTERVVVLVWQEEEPLLAEPGVSVAEDRE
jgi:hypothetical protein